MLNMAARNKLIEGIGPMKSSAEINCIQYADATLIFCKANKRQASNLKLILYSFELLTGLKINFGKSSMIGVELSESKAKVFAELKGCSLSKLPISYFDLSLHSTRIKTSDWNFLVE